MESHFWTRCFICVAMVFALSSTSALAQEEAPQEKLYNFDDMLIDGAFRDPQGMFERAQFCREKRRNRARIGDASVSCQVKGQYNLRLGDSE